MLWDVPARLDLPGGKPCRAPGWLRSGARRWGGGVPGSAAGSGNRYVSRLRGERGVSHHSSARNDDATNHNDEYNGGFNHNRGAGHDCCSNHDDIGTSGDHRCSRSERSLA